MCQAAGRTARAGRFWLGLALSGAATYLAVRAIDPDQVHHVLGAANPAWMTLALASVVATVGAKAARWRALYPGAGGRPRLRALIMALLIGMMANLLVPARVGELARIYVVERLEGQSKALSLSTIVIEKWVDLVMLLLAFAGLLLFLSWPAWLVAWGRGLAWLAGALTAALIGALFLLNQMHPLAERAASLLPARWGDRIMDGWRAVQMGLAALRSAPQMGALLSWTLLVWLLSVGTNWLLLRALALPPSLLIALTLLVILQAGSALPSSPAKIGVFHYLTMLGLGLFHIPQDAALAFAVWLHLVVVILLIGLGILCLIWVSLRDDQRDRSGL